MINALRRPATHLATLLCLGSSALMALPAHAAKLVVQETVTLDAAPAEVWKTLGDFGNLSWHPAVAATSISSGSNNQVGAVRTIQIKDNGGVIEEKLLARDEARRSLKYTILKSPLPVAHYVSLLKVEAAGKGSKVVWSGAFERSEEAKKAGVTDAKAKEVMAGVYRGGLDALKNAK